MSIVDSQNTITKISRGNPGAITVLTRVLRERGEDQFSGVVNSLRVMGFSGPDIWIGYKDYAGEDLGRFIACVRERNEEMQGVINRAAGR